MSVFAPVPYSMPPWDEKKEGLGNGRETDRECIFDRMNKWGYCLSLYDKIKSITYLALLIRQWFSTFFFNPLAHINY